MGTAGHVDHGKTSLIKALTGFDCDTHKEEKTRGITINLGFTSLKLSNGESIGIIDVPGHKDFINTMVGGACGIDFVMLVIAADSGIMPQTVEHMNIINALGVKKGIVALTKIDLVDKELIEMAKYEIMEFLENTSLHNAAVIGVSSITGEGKEELIAVIENLISEIEIKEKEDLFRMYIDRIFSVKGFGCVVTGSVLGGSIETGKDVFLLPGKNQKLRVRSIERHGAPVEKVFAGDRAAINLIGLKTEDFKRGMIISDKELKETQMIDASISLFDNNSELPLWSTVTFHSGTFESMARMHAINKDNIQEKGNVIVQIHFEKPAVLLNKDKFIIRNSSGDKTLGGGYIIDVTPLHHKKRTTALIENLSQLSETILSENSHNDLIKIELKKELRPFTAEEIADNLNLNTDQLKAAITDPNKNFLVYQIDDKEILIDKGFNDTFKNKILKILQEYHQEFPLFENGFEVGELTGKLALAKIKHGKSYLNLLLKKMESEGLIENFKNTWIIKGHKPSISDQVLNEINWLEKEILQYGIQKVIIPEIEERCAAQKISKHQLKMYLSYLNRMGKIQFFQNDLIHSDLVNKFRTVLLGQLKGKEAGIEINEFKEKLNATKYLCAMLVKIYETEKIITTQGSGIETKIFITQTGKNYS